MAEAPRQVSFAEAFRFWLKPGLLGGFKPAVVAVVVEAVLKIGGRALKRRVHLLIAAAAFVAIFYLHVPFPLIVLTAALVALLARRGAARVHAAEYLFLTKAALVTFGGAYAVLAYVTQATTRAPYNRLTEAQAADGLALAETTPGPPIMVLRFVGLR